MADIVAEINGYNSIQRLVQEYGNTKRAAESLGVSQRTVQRWMRGQYKPSRANQQKLNRAGHPRGVRIDFEGKIAINGSGEGYERERHIYQNYSNAEWDKFSEMAMNGDEEGIMQMVADLYPVNTFEVVDGTIDISSGNWQQ